jgi:hypothetical protein
MVVVATIASNIMSTKIQVKAYHTKVAHALKVGATWVPTFNEDRGYEVLSLGHWRCSPHEVNWSNDEFLVLSQGSCRALVEEVRKANIFIDTGKRLKLDHNLWCEVWRVRPEHFTQIEKENQHETPDQPECEP